MRLKNQTLMMILLSRQYRVSHMGQAPCVPRSRQNPSGRKAEDLWRSFAKTPLALLTPLGHHLSACECFAALTGEPWLASMTALDPRPAGQKS